MPSSNPTSGDPYTITEVRYEWTDNGHSYWTVFYHMEGSDPKDGWGIRVRATDELGAYVEAIRRLEGAS